MPLFLPTTTLNPSLHFLNQPLKPSHNNKPFPCFAAMQTSSSTMSAGQSSFDLKTYWTSLVVEINRMLDEAMVIKYPWLLYESMRYSVLSPNAKRVAPVMCVASCELFGGSREAALPTACALEMVHAASLIHDDTCKDDDPVCRERPSNHAIYGSDMAILAGDALFPLGFQHIVSHTPPGSVPETTLIRVVTEMARTVGPTGMAGGQIVGDGDNSTEFVQQKKFGELSKCSAVCGAILGGATDDEVNKLGKYGQTVGVLYQVMEDVLEEKKVTPEETEKKKKGKSSFTKVFGVEKAIEKAEMLRAKAKNELDGLEKYGERLQPLLSFVDYVVDRSFTLEVEDVVNATNHVENAFNVEDETNQVENAAEVEDETLNAEV